MGTTNASGRPTLELSGLGNAMDFAANFTAIDFETANRRSDSACQLGLVTVRDGRIVDQACWLIRPRPLYFQRTHIEIHGITPDQVRGEPEFGDLWPEVAERISDDCLVAHNASFDLGVLIASLQAHGQPIPELVFTCTRAIARRTWPHHRRYGLKPLSDWLGIRFQHHDALEDAVACAKILLAAGMDREATSLPDLERRLRLRRGKAGDWGIRNPGGSSRTRPRGGGKPATGASGFPLVLPNQLAGSSDFQSNPIADQVDLQRLMIRAGFIRPLAGLQVVFAGRFRMLTSEQARDLAVQCGAVCQDDPDESTDLMVVGQSGKHAKSVSCGPRTDSLGTPESAPQTADVTQDAKRPRRVISEDEFLRIAGTPLSGRS